MISRRNNFDRFYLCFSTNCNKFSPFIEPLNLHFGQQECPKIGKIVKNGGSRSTIWIGNNFARVYYC